MPRVATKLTPTKGGGFTARKRIPEDVQDDYERLYDVRWEARLTIDPGTPMRCWRVPEHREWLIGNRKPHSEYQSNPKRRRAAVDA